MARLIDCSRPDVVACQTGIGLTGKLKIALAHGWKAHRYTADDIASVDLIDEEKYRSAGGAAAGAIIGGVLTGGIGLLAGAALGGRRRHRAAFLVRFLDGHHVAFEETQKTVVQVLMQMQQRARARAMLAGADAAPLTIDHPPPLPVGETRAAASRTPVLASLAPTQQPPAPPKRRLRAALKALGWAVLMLLGLFVALIVALVATL